MVYMDAEGHALMPASPIIAPEDFDVLICLFYKSWLTCPDGPEASESRLAAAVGFGSRVAQRARALFPKAAYVVLRSDPEVEEHWMHTVLDASGEPVAPWVTDGDVPADAEDRFDELHFFGACLAHLTLGSFESPAEVTLGLDGLARLLNAQDAVR